MILNYRKDSDCYRVWTDKMDKYGQFQVLSAKEFQDLRDEVLIQPKDSLLARFIGPIVFREAED